MPFGDIVVDVCRQADTAKLKELMDASKAYWSDKGYKLISDDVGKDFVRLFASKIAGEIYVHGSSLHTESGDVILVYQR